MNKSDLDSAQLLWSLFVLTPLISTRFIWNRLVLTRLVSTRLSSTHFVSTCLVSTQLLSNKLVLSRLYSSRLNSTRFVSSLLDLSHLDSSWLGETRRSETYSCILIIKTRSSQNNIKNILSRLYESSHLVLSLIDSNNFDLFLLD